MSSKTVETARWLAYFDRVARGVLLLGGAFIILRTIVASLQVCTAGESCPPIITSEAVVTALFGVIVVYAGYRFQPE
jgi:hypothetical protein